MDIRFVGLGRRFDGLHQERMIFEGFESLRAPISRELIVIRMEDGKPKLAHEGRPVNYYTGEHWKEVLRKIGLSQDIAELVADETSITLVWKSWLEPKFRQTFYHRHFRDVVERVERKSMRKTRLRFTGKQVLTPSGLPLRVTYFPRGRDSFGYKQGVPLFMH